MSGVTPYVGRIKRRSAGFKSNGVQSRTERLSTFFEFRKVSCLIQWKNLFSNGRRDNRGNSLTAQMFRERAEYILRTSWGRFYVLRMSLRRPQDTLCCLDCFSNWIKRITFLNLQEKDGEPFCLRSYVYNHTHTQPHARYRRD